MGDFFKYWGWGDTWGVFFVLLAAAVLTLGARAILDQHAVVDYYLTTTPCAPGVFCVAADINWADDKIVYCSDDPAKVISYLNAAKASLKKGENK